MIDQQAVLSRDPDQRKRLLLQVQRVLVDQAVNISIDFRRSLGFTQPEVVDFYPPFVMTNHTEYWQSVWFNK